MGPQGNHDVNVKLKFGADTMQASKAVQDLAKQTERLGKTAKDAHEAQRRITDGSPNSISASGGGGFNSMLGGAKLVAATYIASQAINGLTRAIGTFSDSTVSMSEKIKKSVEQVIDEIPVASSIFKAGKDLSREIFYGNSKRALEKRTEEEQVRMTEFDINNAAEQSRRSLRINREGEKSRFWDMGANARRDTARTTAGLAFGGMVIAGAAQDPRLADISRGVDAAEIEANELRARKEAILREEVETRNSRKNLNMRRHEVEGEPGNNEYDEEKRRSKLRELDSKLLAKDVELEELSNQKKSVSLALEQKIYDVAKRKNDLAKAKVDILREDEAKAKGREESFGLMGAGDKLGLLYAIRQIKQSGIESVPEDVRNLAVNNPVTGDWARGLAAKSVDRDPVWGMVAKEMGFERASDITAKRLEAEAKVNIKFNVNSEELAKSLEKSIDAHMPEMMEIISKIAEDRIKAFNNRARPVQ